MVLYYSSRHRVARRFPPTEDFQGLPDCVGQAPCLTSRAKVVRHPKGLCTGLMLRADASVFAKATPDKRLVGQGATTYYLTIFFARRYFIPIGQKKREPPKRLPLSHHEERNLRLHLAATAGSGQRGHTQREQRHRPRLRNRLDLIGRKRHIVR